MDANWSSIFRILRDDSVSEVQANGPNEFFIKRAGRRERLNVNYGDKENYFIGIEESLVPNMESITNWNRNSYLFEGPLEVEIDGVKIRARCTIVLPPATESPQISVAKKSIVLGTVEDIAQQGSMSAEMANFLKMAVKSRLSIVISGGTGSGKSLALDTVIQTPTGPTTMGEIQVGDQVFDRFGDVVDVSHKYPQPPRQVYELELETDEKIECDSEHNWSIISVVKGEVPGEDLQPQVWTTEEVEEEIASGDRDLYIPVLTSPIEYKDPVSEDGELFNSSPSELPLHPYLLGLWLGAGSRDGAQLKIEKYDEVRTILSHLDLGVEAPKVFDENTQLIEEDFKGVLVELGLLNGTTPPARFIPDLYRFSDQSSRKFLLEGFSDSLSSGKSGVSRTLSTKSSRLAADLKSLLNSLGFKGRVRRKRDFDPVTGDVSFNYSLRLPSVRVPTFRKVIGVSEKDRLEEMACITVNSTDKTYLITDSFIPTHNTTMLEAMTKHIDKESRVGIAEDTPELSLTNIPNKTFVHSVPWQPGLDKNKVATLQWCVQQFQRMRTDLLIIGETRGKEFADFLVAANSGMDGSMTTIHANTSKMALDKMSNFALRGSERQPIRSINTDIANSVDLIVQLILLPDGRHKVSEITEVTKTLSNDEQATIATEVLYEYDPVEDVFMKRASMTDDMRDLLTSRGTDITTFISTPIGSISRADDSRSLYKKAKDEVIEQPTARPAKTIPARPSRQVPQRSRMKPEMTQTPFSQGRRGGGGLPTNFGQ